MIIINTGVAIVWPSKINIKGLKYNEGLYPNTNYWICFLLFRYCCFSLLLSHTLNAWAFLTEARSLLCFKEI